MKRLSIIVPVYNLERHIERCIDSLYAQDLGETDYEVIFIDDGSTDRSAEIIRSRWKKNMVLLHQENARQGAARNNGLNRATGRYVWFVDGDDAITPNCLRQLLDVSEQRQLDILFFGQQKFSDDGRFITKRNCASRNDSGNVFSGKEYLSKRTLALGPCYIFKKQFLTENHLSFMEKTFFEDSEFMPKACFYAQRIMHLECAPYLIYERVGSSTRSRNPDSAFDALKVSTALGRFATANNPEKAAAHLFYYSVMIFNTAMKRLQDTPKDKKCIFFRKIPLKQVVSAMLHSRCLKYYAEAPYIAVRTLIGR